MDRDIGHFAVAPAPNLVAFGVQPGHKPAAAYPI